MPAYNSLSTEIETVNDANGNTIENAYGATGNIINTNTPEPRKELINPVVASLFATVPVTGVKQGGCSDGTYLYQMIRYRNEMIKYHIVDGTYDVIDLSGLEIDFSHANDMTYNPENDCVYVCTMKNDGSIIVLNASDLSYVETIYATDLNGSPVTVWQFCYDRNKNCFYSAGYSDGVGGMFVYDEDFTCTDFFVWPELEATAQGCETDGTYIYRVTNGPMFDTATVDGEHVNVLIVQGVSEEPETLMYDWNGNYYLSCNTGTDGSWVVYKCEVVEEIT